MNDEDRARERAENAERIRRQLAERNTPLDRIFPVVERQPREALWTPSPVATFSATDIPSPIGGTAVRAYILDCPHGTLEEEHRDARPEFDAIVLQRMTVDLHRGTGCRCEAWVRA